MKILVIGDVHWSQYSSILRKRGNKYSYRLENLIQSVNWAERLSCETFCDCVVYLGDFFDRSDCNSEELSALKEIHWDNKPHYFLVGNHEVSGSNMIFNSTNIFDLANFSIINEPYVKKYNDFELCFLPYILEDDRKDISEYFNGEYGKRIIFSHNDIKGYQMGKFISQEGFDIADIDKSCDLYLNGHLHNGGKVTNKIINVGNLTGQNFSEDAFKYDHSVILLDTDNITCAVYENPYALNFYKIDFTENNDIDYINQLSMQMKKNCLATIKCKEEDSSYLRSRFDPNYRNETIPYNCNMVESRFVIQLSKSNNLEKKQEEFHIDYLNQFSNYMIDLLGDSDVLQYELSEVFKCN